MFAWNSLKFAVVAVVTSVRWLSLQLRQGARTTSKAQLPVDPQTSSTEVARSMIRG